MLHAAEALLFHCSNKLAVADDRGRGIAVECIKPQNDHTRPAELVSADLSDGTRTTAARKVAFRTSDLRQEGAAKCTQAILNLRELALGSFCQILGVSCKVNHIQSTAESGRRDDLALLANEGVTRFGARWN